MIDLSRLSVDSAPPGRAQRIWIIERATFGGQLLLAGATRTGIFRAPIRSHKGFSRLVSASRHRGPSPFVFDLLRLDLIHRLITVPDDQRAPAEAAARFRFLSGAIKRFHSFAGRAHRFAGGASGIGFQSRFYRRYRFAVRRDQSPDVREGCSWVKAIFFIIATSRPIHEGQPARLHNHILAPFFPRKLHPGPPSNFHVIFAGTEQTSSCGRPATTGPRFPGHSRSSGFPKCRVPGHRV